MFSSCKKEGITNSTPDCIVDMIDGYKADLTTVPKPQVYRYRYNGETVYHIVPGCCDQRSTLYDKECNVICEPDGGLDGQGDGNCTDFFDEGKKKTLVWNEAQD